MAEHSFGQFDRPDSLDSEFAVESDIVRGANRLPTLSSQLRDRVLGAATAAYQSARRWATARQAASLFSLCLIASVVMSPLAQVEWPQPPSVSDQFAEWHSLLVIEETAPPDPDSVHQTVWSLRHNREFLDLPQPKQSTSAGEQVESVKSQRAVVAASSRIRPKLIAQTEPIFPEDQLLQKFRSSDGWEAVDAFEAVQSRSRTTLQRAFAAN